MDDNRRAALSGMLPASAEELARRVSERFAEQPPLPAALGIPQLREQQEPSIFDEQRAPTPTMPPLGTVPADIAAEAGIRFASPGRVSSPAEGPAPEEIRPEAMSAPPLPPLRSPQEAMPLAAMALTMDAGPSVIRPAWELADGATAQEFRSIQRMRDAAVRLGQDYPERAVSEWKKIADAQARLVDQRLRGIFGSSPNLPPIEETHYTFVGSGPKAGFTETRTRADVPVTAGLFHPALSAFVWGGAEDEQGLARRARMLAGFSTAKLSPRGAAAGSRRNAYAIDWAALTGGKNALGYEQSLVPMILADAVQDGPDAAVQERIFRVLNHPAARDYMRLPMPEGEGGDAQLAGVRARMSAERILAAIKTADPRWATANLAREIPERSWSNVAAIERRARDHAAAGRHLSLELLETDARRDGDSVAAYIYGRARDEVLLAKPMDWGEAAVNVFPSLGRTAAGIFGMVLAVPTAIMEIAATAVREPFEGGNGDATALALKANGQALSRYAEGLVDGLVEIPGNLKTLASFAPGLEGLATERERRVAIRKYEADPVFLAMDVSIIANGLTRGIGAIAKAYQRGGTAPLFQLLGEGARGAEPMAVAQRAAAALARLPERYVAGRFVAEMSKQTELHKVTLKTTAATAPTGQGVAAATLKRLDEANKALGTAVSAAKGDAITKAALGYLSGDVLRRLALADDMYAVIENSYRAVLGGQRGWRKPLDALALWTVKALSGPRGTSGTWFTRPSEVQAAVKTLIQRDIVQNSTHSASVVMEKLSAAMRRTAETHGLAEGEATMVAILAKQGLAGFGKGVGFAAEQPWRQMGKSVFDAAVAQDLPEIRIGGLRVQRAALSQYAAGEKGTLSHAEIEAMRTAGQLPRPTWVRAHHLTYEEYLRAKHRKQISEVEWQHRVRKGLDDGEYADMIRAGRIGVDRAKQIVERAGLTLPASAMQPVAVEELIGGLVYDAIATTSERVLRRFRKAPASMEEIQGIAEDLGITEGQAAWRYFRDRIRSPEFGLPQITGLSRDAVAEAVSLDAAFRSMGVEGTTVVSTFANIYDRLMQNPLAAPLSETGKRAFAVEGLAKLQPRLFRVAEMADAPAYAMTASGKVKEFRLGDLLEELYEPLEDVSTVLYQAGIDCVAAGLFDTPAAILANDIRYLHRTSKGAVATLDALEGTAPWRSMPTEVQSAAKKAWQDIGEEMRAQEWQAAAAENWPRQRIDRLPTALAEQLLRAKGALERRTVNVGQTFRPVAEGGGPRAQAAAEYMGAKAFQGAYQTGERALATSIRDAVALQGVARSLMVIRREAAAASRTIRELYDGLTLSQEARDFLKAKLGIEMKTSVGNGMARLGVLRQLIGEIEAIEIGKLPLDVQKMIEGRGFRGMNKALERSIRGDFNRRAFEGISVTPEVDVAMWGMHKDSPLAGQNLVRRTVAAFKENVVGLNPDAAIRDLGAQKYVVGPTYGLFPDSPAWDLAGDLAYTENGVSAAMRRHGAFNVLDWANEQARPSRSAMGDIVGLMRDLERARAPWLTKLREARDAGDAAGAAKAQLGELAALAGGVGKFITLRPGKTTVGRWMLRVRSGTDQVARAAYLAHRLAKEAAHILNADPTKLGQMRATWSAMGIVLPETIGPNHILAAIGASTRRGRKAAKQAGKEAYRAAKALPEGVSASRSATIRDAQSAATGATLDAAFRPILDLFDEDALAKLMQEVKDFTVDYSDKSRLLDLITGYGISPFLTYYIRQVPRMTAYWAKHPVESIARLQSFRALQAALWEKAGETDDVPDVERILPFYMRGPWLPLFPGVNWLSPVTSSGTVEATGGFSAGTWTPYWGSIGDVMNPALSSPFVAAGAMLFQMLSPGGGDVRMPYPWQRDASAPLGVTAGGPYAHQQGAEGTTKLGQILASFAATLGPTWATFIAPGEDRPWIKGAPRAQAMLDAYFGSDKASALVRPPALAFLRSVIGANVKAYGKIVPAVRHAGETAEAQTRASSIGEEAARRERPLDWTDTALLYLSHRTAGAEKALKAGLDRDRAMATQDVPAGTLLGRTGAQQDADRQRLSRLLQWRTQILDRTRSIAEAMQARMVWGILTPETLEDREMAEQLGGYVEQFLTDAMVEMGDVMERGARAIKDGEDPPEIEDAVAYLSDLVGAGLTVQWKQDDRGRNVVQYPAELPRFSPRVPGPSAARLGAARRLQNEIEPEHTIMQNVPTKTKSPRGLQP